MVPLSPTPFLPSRFQPRPEERRRQDGHEQGPWGRLGGPAREAGRWWCHENQPAVPWNVLMCVTHRRRGGPATVKERDTPGGNQPRLPRSPPWESDPGPGQGKAMGWLDVRVFHVPVLSHTGALGTSRPTYTPKRTAAKHQAPVTPRAGHRRQLTLVCTPQASKLGGQLQTTLKHHPPSHLTSNTLKP